MTKRHTVRSAISGLLFTDLMPPCSETDIGDASGGRPRLCQIPPVIVTKAAEYPNPVERFLNRATLTVARGPLLSTDVAITDAWSPLAKLRNDGRVYAALWELARERGRQMTEHVWKLQVGYAELSRVSLCSVRALARAFPRLAALQYAIRYPAAHDGKIATTYWVRSPEGCSALLASAGCTHVRILRGRAIELCGQADRRNL